MTRILLERAGLNTTRVVHALEGGYHPERTGRGVVSVLRALASLPE
jgi:hypothetical protein